ncbi:hypothetical protein [Paraburkholderia acidipaludis]|uniref:hypothetical protein n=1 Tax=Paraburkholderia acidipaludis TaxID=660537 RepID=UPI000484E1A1|nr:hypothetical protein [Paraburkholderia acidipaludis]
MIGAQAKDSIERIFFSAVRTRLVTDAQHHCEISPRPAEAAQGAQVVVLTISSMQFRLLLLLHFEDDEATRRYYMGDTQGSLTESFMEFGNLCCGAMNQQLVEHFPDLGMSTPYALSSACLPYLRELKPDYVSTYALTLDGSVRLGATLCVCSQTSLDFVAAQTETANEGAGELELF